MSFLPAILLAALAFLVAAFVLRVPRSGWTLMGAALLFGLAGYALQGSPDDPGAPKSASGEPAGEGAAAVDARRALFGPLPATPFVTMADAYARRGKFADAAAVLRGGVTQSPEDAEAWLALAIALTEHAEGQLTPASALAFDKAQRLAPANPGPGLFFGVALIRSGQLMQARSLWADMLARAPADAPWRAGMKERLDRLDVLIAQAGGQ